jgi:heme exporter protein A
MPMDGLAIDASHLARRYGRRWALADVSFQLERGRVMMVAGRNGSGKTTLLRILSTAIRPDGGRALVAGYEVAGHREEIRRETALLAHYSYLYEALTARENLDIVARFCGAPPPSAANVLERVGLADRADDPVSAFSAGMRKRLSFARVLLQKPTIAFLDEPYGQLDPEGFTLVEDVVGELKRAGATVLIATHQVDRVGRFADAQLVLERGRVA